MRVHKYTEEDYNGELKLAKHEREWILIAAIISQGDREKLSKTLKITTRTLYNKINQHNLSTLLIYAENLEIQKVSKLGKMQYRVHLPDGSMFVKDVLEGYAFVKFVEDLVTEFLSKQNK